MSTPEQPGVALSRHLRRLRLERWPRRKVTQKELGEALGAAKPLSEPLISSWESTTRPVPPPDRWLAAYARLFATERSIDGDKIRLLADEELTEAETAVRDDLLRELLRLRYPTDQVGDTTLRQPLAGPFDTIGGGFWHFPDQRPITIVCGRLPPRMLKTMPFTDPNDPDYARLYSLADIDALLELYGHVRAVNPTVQVTIRAADELAGNDLTKHLVLLGGVDWNNVIKDVSRHLQLPVRQQSRATQEHDYDACFETVDGASKRQFRPVVERSGSTITLREDVALFFRGQNPFNARRTVTICDGMFGRGTYGAVRALTDVWFRDRNDWYVSQRFSDATAFSILARVSIVNGEVVTPDWTQPDNRLYEWPELPS